MCNTHTQCGFALCVVPFCLRYRELVEIDKYEGTKRTICSCYIMI